MMILDRIVAYKKKEVQERKKIVSPETLQERCRLTGEKGLQPAGQGRFARSLRKNGEVALIAEIKKASPSKGVIRPDFNPREIALIYSAGGASAISVLTDREFFQGDPGYLAEARKVSDLPLLRKDFIIDEYQIYEAKVLGADALLLIMAILTDGEAGRFMDTAARLGLECLVEVHTRHELDRALALGARVIGINNRNLKSFATDLTTTFKLRAGITDPAVTVVSESGINTRQDVLRLKEHGVHAMLVGEALMREPDIAEKIFELLGKRENTAATLGEAAL